MSFTLSKTSTVVAAKEQISCDLSGEAAILNLKNGIYYGLNHVGARVWSLIQEPKTVRELCDTLLFEYETESEQCENDLLELLQDLASNELIEVRN